MTGEKTDLYAINSTPSGNLPPEALQDFEDWVLGKKLKPSESLKKLMKKYNCPSPKASSVIGLLEKTYDDCNFAYGGFRFTLGDSGYPNSYDESFDDEAFDSGIETILKHPNKGY